MVIIRSQYLAFAGSVREEVFSANSDQEYRKFKAHPPSYAGTQASALERVQAGQIAPVGTDGTGTIRRWGGMASCVRGHSNRRWPADKPPGQRRSRAGVVGGEAEREKLVRGAASVATSI